MCLILFAYRMHPSYRMIVAANRDESYTRPTAPAGFWTDAPAVLAGRDLLHGGTWLGFTRSGRFAAVSNYRETSAALSRGPSRGHLVANYLLGDESPTTYLKRVAAEGARYPGFNLIAGDSDALYYFSNRAAGIQRLGPGLHGVSNALLDTPWPKVESGKALLREQTQAHREPQVDALLAGLTDRRLPADSRLPDTGVGLERERELAPLFIRGREYGTRSSTVLLVDYAGGVRFVECSYDPQNLSATTIRHAFHTLRPAAGKVPKR